MAKVRTPLLSFGASGQIGKSMVMASWKGRDYAREYVIPANPRTSAQTTVRNSWQWLNRTFPYLPAGALGAWDLYADNNRFTNRNGFLKVNQPLIRSETDIALMLLSIAAGGGVATGGSAFTAASQAIDVVVTEPVLPAGWTVNAAWAMAMENVNPQSEVTPDVGSATDATDPYEPDVSGLLASTEYLINSWLVYNKPNGELAYSTPDVALITTLA